jgi:hypothetical protein
VTGAKALGTDEASGRRREPRNLTVLKNPSRGRQFSHRSSEHRPHRHRPSRKPHKRLSDLPTHRTLSELKIALLRSSPLLLLILAYFLVAQALVFICRSKRRSSPNRARQSKSNPPRGVLHTLYREAISLFVDDATLAIGILVWAVGAWVCAGRLPVNSLSQCALFLTGFLLLLGYSAVRSVR